MGQAIRFLRNTHLAFMVDPKLEEGTKFRQAENYSPGPNLELMLKLWLVC